MPRIKQLPQEVVSKIAAGEVIERPASVLKELLENSLDAGATRVDIDVEQGGVELIRVVDDGCGIEPEDLELAFCNHATSKLSEADDLFRIHTLGFRGEALASVGSVAKVTLQSRPRDAACGAEIRCQGAVLSTVRAWNGAVGTRIEVRDLFYNTPVRRKFLRTTATEIGHICEMVTRIALACPHLHVVLRHNQKLIYEVPASAGLLDRIGIFFGSPVRDALYPVRAQQGDAALTGFIADPSCDQRNASRQYFFVNGRWVRDRMLSHALQESYRGLLMTGRHAVAFLYLQVPPDWVDVNVHPTKAEVRFRESDQLYRLIRSAVREKLNQTNLIPRLVVAGNSAAASASAAGGASPAPPPPAPWELPPAASASPSATVPPPAPWELPPAASASPSATADQPTAATADNHHHPAPAATLTLPVNPDSNRPLDLFALAMGQSQTTAQDVPRSPSAPAPNAPPPPDGPAAPPPATDRPATPTPSASPVPPVPPGSPTRPVQPAPSASAARPARPAAPAHSAPPQMSRAIQLHDAYLVVETQDGILIIDQHALHERILFEQIQARLREGHLERQRLLIPEPIELHPEQAGRVLEYAAELERLGLEVSDLGGGTVLLSSYPALLGRGSPRELFLGVVETLTAKDRPPQREQLFNHLISTMACKAAVKMGDRLSPQEIAALVAQRELATDSHHCPHGRPTSLFFSRKDLDKQFRRL